MGLYFELQCTECGYQKTLYDGECGLEHLGAMKIKREFESGEGDPVYREIFERLKSTVTEEESIGSLYTFLLKFHKRCLFQALSGTPIVH